MKKKSMIIFILFTLTTKDDVNTVDIHGMVNLIPFNLEDSILANTFDDSLNILSAILVELTNSYDKNLKLKNAIGIFGQLNLILEKFPTKIIVENLLNMQRLYTDNKLRAEFYENINYFRYRVLDGLALIVKISFKTNYWSEAIIQIQNFHKTSSLYEKFICSIFDDYIVALVTSRLELFANLYKSEFLEKSVPILQDYYTNPNIDNSKKVFNYVGILSILALKLGGYFVHHLSNEFLAQLHYFKHDCFHNGFEIKIIFILSLLNVAQNIYILKNMIEGICSETQCFLIKNDWGKFKEKYQNCYGSISQTTITLCSSVCKLYFNFIDTSLHDSILAIVVKIYQHEKGGPNIEYIYLHILSAVMESQKICEQRITNFILKHGIESIVIEIVLEKDYKHRIFGIQILLELLMRKIKKRQMIKMLNLDVLGIIFGFIDEIILNKVVLTPNCICNLMNGMYDCLANLKRKNIFHNYVNLNHLHTLQTLSFKYRDTEEIQHIIGIILYEWREE